MTKERQRPRPTELLPSDGMDQNFRHDVLGELAVDLDERRKYAEFYTRFVEDCRILFEATREARHLQDALAWCKEGDLPVPHWLRDALSDLLTSGDVDKKLRRDTPKRRRMEHRRKMIWFYMQDLLRERDFSTQGESDIHALADRAAEVWNKQDAHAYDDPISGETARKDYYEELDYRNLIVECRK